MAIRWMIVYGFLSYLASIFFLESCELTLLLHLFALILHLFVKIQGFDENNQQADIGMCDVSCLLLCSCLSNCERGGVGMC